MGSDMGCLFLNKALSLLLQLQPQQHTLCTHEGVHTGTDASAWSHSGNRGYTSGYSPSMTLWGTDQRPDMLPS